MVGDRVEFCQIIHKIKLKFLPMSFSCLFCNPIHTSVSVVRVRDNIFDMLRGNASDVANIDFELYAKRGDKL